MLTQVIGYTAGIIAAVALAPQIIKAWKTKSTEDISLIWTLVYIFGLLWWVAYGVVLNEWPIIITNIVEILLAVSLLILKIKHG